MAKNCSIETKNGITLVSFTTGPTKEDICDAIDAIAENPLNSLRLWDLSNGEEGLTSSQIQALADYGKSKLRFPSKVAIVAPNDLMFGLSRIYEVFSEREETETKTFRTRHEAMAWLQSEVRDS